MTTRQIIKAAKEIYVPVFGENNTHYVKISKQVAKQLLKDSDRSNDGLYIEINEFASEAFIEKRA